MTNHHVTSLSLKSLHCLIAAADVEGLFPDALRQTHIPMLTHEYCYGLFLDSHFTVLSEGMMCAGRLEGGHDTCEVRYPCHLYTLSQCVTVKFPLQ